MVFERQENQHGSRSDGESAAANVPSMRRGGDVPETIHAAAARGVAGPSGALPHLDVIQRLFGRHAISHMQSHIGSEDGCIMLRHYIR
jgi:hypothetical protein